MIIEENIREARALVRDTDALSITVGAGLGTMEALKKAIP